MKTHSRRDFLIQAALVSMGVMLFPYCKKSSKEKDSDEEIIVVGARIAGLAAAGMLTFNGYKVTVLEADNRYGGRIKTVDIDGYKADFGASWIHGIHGNPLYDLANKNGLITKPTYYDPSYIFDTDGEEVTDEEWKTIEKLLGQLTDLAYTNPDTSLQHLLDLMEPGMNLSDKLYRAFFGAVRSEIEIPYAVDAPDLAAKALTTNDSFPGRDVIFPNGMQELTGILAKGLNIRYNTFVTKISYTGDKISVFTKNPQDIDPKRSCIACHGGTDASLLEHDGVFTSDRVIMALPLAMLKNNNVIFEPPLPSGKQDAINSLGIGTMNKVFLKFGENFWSEDGYFFEYLKDDHSKIIEFFSPAPTGTKNVIVAVLAGQHARSIEKMGDDQVLNIVKNDLKGMFGSGISTPVAMKKTSWHTNPYSLGSYPHLKPGTDLSACDVIAAPLGNKVFFAGDATSRKYMATAHGAYLSGIAAADSIMKSV